MSSVFRGEDVHVLGYGIDHRDAGLRAALADLQERRRRRVGVICGKLAALGVALEPADVLREAGGKSVGRRHVARALLRKGHVRSIEEAFARYLGTDSPAHVPAHEMTPREAARLIGRHGGVPVFAHPGFLDDDALVEEVLDAAPLRGIEVFHRYDSPTKHLAYLEMARRRNLHVTGGSDFHGDDSPRNAALGGCTCPAEYWKDLEKNLAPL
jgi:predicted metal-dependent phosphoesterase TrpH